MKIYELSNTTDFDKIANFLNVTKEGIKILKKKSNLKYIFIKNLRTPAVQILKQTALSNGADLAVPKGVIINEKAKYNCLLMTTQNQLEKIISNLKQQDFGLKDLAKTLHSHLNLKPKAPQIMGVLNINEDSFNQESRAKGKNAINKIQKMIEEGANIIDIGALSSRPGSSKISPEAELDRLREILDEIYKQKLYEKAIFSLDSYEPLCLEYAFDRGFKIANDIYGLSNEKVAKITAKYNATICIMHMQNDPENMQKEPFYEDVISEVDEFFEKRLEIAYKYGIKDIILDVGIGFGKTLEHNLLLLKHHRHFLHFKHSLLVGASRKSMINAITPSEVKDRLSGTIAIHLEALNQGADIIRVHDVKEHFQALKVWQAFQNTSIQGAK